MTTVINGTTGINTPAIVLTTPLDETSGGTGQSLGVRQLAQIQTFQTGAVATGTTPIPLDNTIPQNTEGNEYMSLAITPVNASSTLEIDVTMQLTNSAAAWVMTAALFQDAAAGALAVATGTHGNAGYINEITIKHIMVAGALTPTTFKLRAGIAAAGTTTFNGQAGAQMMGGMYASRITIKEWLP
jgi:hypothetical protein